MQVRAKVNIKFGDNFLMAGDIVDSSYLPEGFEEVLKEEVKVVKEVVKPKKKKLAK